MRLKLVALAGVLLAAGITTPAHAYGARYCVIDDDGVAGGDTNEWTFTPANVNGGNWSWKFEGRVCNGTPGAPLALDLGGTYLGDPCGVVNLSGDPQGFLVGGSAPGTSQGVTHAGPGGGYIGIESIHVLQFDGPCVALDPTLAVKKAHAISIQIHTTP